MGERRAVSALLLVVGLTFDCTPPFKSEGGLSIAGAPFVPVACHVLAPRAAGVEIVGAAGDRLDLLLPQAVLGASERIAGAPVVTYMRQGKPPTKLGTCGSFSLDLGGPHGASKGLATLDCAAKGQLSFRGCL